jgi:hypothetical protein
MFLAKIIAIILQECLPDEDALHSILHLILDIFSTKKLIILFKLSYKTLLISVLIQGFEKFQNPIVLQSIMQVLEKLAVHGKDNVKDIITVLGKAFMGLYEELLSNEVQFMVDGNANVSNVNAVTKMTVMMCSIEVRIFGYFEYEAITVINMKYLQYVNGKMFPLFLRFHTITLCQMWNDLVNDEKKRIIPYDLKFIIDSVAVLAQKSLSLLQSRDLSQLEAQNVFISLMDLLYCFHLRPKEYNDECGTAKVLIISQPAIAADDMMVSENLIKINSKTFIKKKFHKAIVNFVNFYVFEKNESEGDKIKAQYEMVLKKNMLTHLGAFVKNYKIPKSLGLLYKLIVHYKEDCLFQIELEMLLKLLLDRRTSFYETIGLFLLHQAKMLVTVEELQSFISPLNMFLQQALKGDEEKISNTKFNVCKYALEHLPSAIKHIPVSDDVSRLFVLVYISKIACEIAPKTAMKL